MKFTLSWLKDYLETDASVAEIATQLTALGLEIEGVTNPAETLGGFRVAEVLAAEKHPDADRLRVCKVSVGAGEPLTIVCGAPNARAGIKVVLAQPGDYIPGLDVTLGASKIRGVASEGMMCSAKELCLGDDHAGIIELPAEAKVGQPALAWLGGADPVFEIGLTPDRADCAGVHGIARDLAAAGLGTLKPLPTPLFKPKFANPVQVKTADVNACPALAGRVIRGVRNGESPAWLKERLEAIGLRPISTLVDITNYFTFTFARPLHVFDAAKIGGNVVQARAAKAGETLQALDEKTYALTDSILTISDATNPLAIAGVMGGEASGCTPQTTDVFLEVAYFNPAAVAHAGRTLGIVSDARYRFERGVDPAFVTQAADLATEMILNLCGGEASELTLAGQLPTQRVEVAYTPTLVQKLGGMDVPPARQQKILEALGFQVTVKGQEWHVVAPSWRVDVEGAADLVEEVLRVVGFDEIPNLPVRPEKAGTGAVSEFQRRAALARRVLAGQRGLNEAVTWSFMDEVLVPLFAPVNPQLVLVNPIAANLNAMRPTPLATLLTSAAKNMDRGVADNRLFEVGPAFRDATPTGEHRVAAGVRTGLVAEPSWAEKARKVDVFDAKADAMALLDAFGLDVEKLPMSTDAGSAYHPGRSGVLRLGKTVVAQFGEIHPFALKKLGIKGRAVGFEVMLDALPQAKKPTIARPLLALSALQALSRDFAFVVAEDVPVADVVKTARGAHELITELTVFDVYQGAGVADGHKSVAISVAIQPQENSLTNEEIEAISQKIMAAVAQKTGGTLRE